MLFKGAKDQRSASDFHPHLPTTEQLQIFLSACTFGQINQVQATPEKAPLSLKHTHHSKWLGKEGVSWDSLIAAINKGQEHLHKNVCQIVIIHSCYYEIHL